MTQKYGYGRYFLRNFKRNSVRDIDFDRPKRHQKNINMKPLSLIIASLFFSSTALAQVPKKAKDISPLLVGESIPNTTLVDVSGKEVSLKSIVKSKPTVLVFYRGGWCPYCNTQLAALAETEQSILDLGYQIIAVSPDQHQNLTPTLESNEVGYTLYSDPEAELIQATGIGFKTPTVAKPFIKSRTKMKATEVLPVPTVMVLNTKGEILFEYINPNYKVRLSEKLLLATLEALKEDI